MPDVNDYGFKISQPGFDVKTCEDKDLVMSSSFNLLKTAQVGSGTSTTVAHGLSYIPIFFSSIISGGHGSVIGNDITTSCDATNLNLGANTVKYYIFYTEGIT